MFICANLWLISLASCASEPANLRLLAPNETLIYLETKDLGATLAALTENPTFKEFALENAAKDFSYVKGIQAAVAVTGFETSEKQLTGENAALNFKPRFALIAETHLWSWQTRAFAEDVLGGFVNETYGGEVDLEITRQNGGDWFEWSSPDATRKAFAFVESSRVFFSNDREAIEKCLAAARGEVENLMKNEALRRAFDAANAENKLAFGYVSTDGIAQIASIAGVSAAIEATETGGGRNFIAGVLPQVLRGTTREIVWTASKNGQKIEDTYFIALDPKFSAVFKETLAPAAQNQNIFAEFLPADVFSATRYSLKNPLVAWRSLLLVTKETTDALSGNLLGEVSRSLLSSYGVRDAEMFLSAVEPEILTAQFDAEGEKSVAIVSAKDSEKVKKSLGDEFDFSARAEQAETADIYYSKDKRFSAAFAGNILVFGDAESVRKCLQAGQNGRNFAKGAQSAKFGDSRATAVTFGKDIDSAEKIVEVLGNLKQDNKGSVTTFLTQTSFTEKGIERKTLSDFGFIGTILEQIE